MYIRMTMHIFDQIVQKLDQFEDNVVKSTLYNIYTYMQNQADFIPFLQIDPTSGQSGQSDRIARRFFVAS